MSDDADRTGGDTARPRPRPTPRPRAGGARPSPRPRVAGSRRAEDDDPAAPGADSTAGSSAGPATPPAGETPRRRPAPRPRAATPAAAPTTAGKAAAAGRAAAAGTAAGTAAVGGADPRSARRARAAAEEDDPGTGAGRPRRLPGGRLPGRAPGRRRDAAPRASAGNRTLALVLAVLCVLVAAGGGWLLWQRLHPTSVDPTIFSATRDGVEAVYAYDYQDSDGSVQRKLDALTGDLRDQYETDLSAGGIIDTYEQVSATTSYDVLEVGLQQVNESQDQATLVVFGQYVVRSVNSGSQAAPAGSECTVTDDGAQSCTQTVRVTVLKADGDWKISELTLLTSS